MSKQKTAPVAERDNALALDIDGLIAMNQRSVDAMMRMNSEIYQNMMRVHTELLNFIGRRLSTDFEVAHKLTGGNLDDAAEAVAGFHRQMIADYAAEASELVNMCTAMAGDLIQDINGDVEKGMGEGAGAVAASPEPRAGERDEEVAAKGPVIKMKAAPKKSREPDLQQDVLDVLSSSAKPVSLREIARRIGKEHYASLIGPMRSLRKTGRIVKEEKMYRMAGRASQT